MLAPSLFLVWIGLAQPAATPSPIDRPTPAASKAETERYVVEMRPAQKSYRAGADGKIDVVFEAKGEFKLNAQFPLKLKLEAPPEGVTFEKQILKREDAKTAEKGGSFSVSFKPEKAGTYKLAGVLSVSFCSEKTCLMEKLPLDTEVVVK